MTFGLMLAAAAFSANAARPDASSHNAKSAETARQAQTYASLSKTNPFEIVGTPEMTLPETAGDFQDMVSDLLSYAKTHLGTRYVRGGKTPKGFDCSGFTSHVFSQFGTSLGASSAAQFTQGVKIERDEVMPGDLLFFTGRSASSKRVGHVAIALDNDPQTGEITFIHAAIGGGIRIDKMSAHYYKTRYLGARRVL